ncbi:shikimate kinase [Metabacillus malikii]|uniref:Shikimate kinase n=1 Tax=Metabacillus malikii TaxID=1504265 RepID=A0ABT9ZI52_9BACI|nr:shikimate kinase [Metabacillus malikii]MDQ0231961.1 shikimate kinase [Metabacillus malikii]
MKAIYLTGFMGAGKTTIGEALAERLALPVRDTDKEIERTTGLTIKQIFEEHGEQYFRDLETEILKNLPKDNIIITTGGGIVIRNENRIYMKESGVIILLHADLDVIYDRIHHDSNRPIANKKSKEELVTLYLSRESYYEDCTRKINTDNKSIDDITEEIIQSLKN